MTTAVHDADGVPLALTDALGHTTTFSYSDTGRRSSVTDPMGVKTRFTYDENGNVLTRTTPNTSFGTKQLQIYAWEYDDPAHPGDMTSSIDPLGNETDYTYNSRGLLASVTDPLGNRMIIGHDTLGNPGPLTDALGHTTDYTYDAVGNLLTTTDATGATTTNTYDSDNELTSRPRSRGPDDHVLLQRGRPADRRPHARRLDQPRHIRRRRRDQNERRPGGRYARLTYDALGRTSTLPTNSAGRRASPTTPSAT